MRALHCKDPRGAAASIMHKPRIQRWAPPQKVPKPEKYDFEKMKVSATSDRPEVRKAAFLEYYERFGEFPSYLFDNEKSVDLRLSATIQALLKDPDSSRTLLRDLDALLMRLPYEKE